MKISDICKVIMRNREGETPEPQRDRGITIHSCTLYAPNFQDRVIVDCASDFLLNEWEDLSTYQDAPYFGVWFSRKCLAILTLCEGDWTFESAMTLEEFEAELTRTREYYRKAAAPRT